MKTKQKQELHQKTREELENILRTAKAELLSLRLDHSLKKLKNTSSILHKRKEMAVIYTVLKEKDLPAHPAGKII